VAELRADDLIDPDDTSPLRAAGYPPLKTLPDYPAALLEAVRVYLWDDLLTAFLPRQSSSARFMVNSVDAVSASPAGVLVRGRGYHAGPGVPGHAEP